MTYLFDEWQRLSKKFAPPGKILLLTDYDGTLTPIVNRPQAATLSKNTKKLLLSISGKKRFKVGILSGRSIGEVKRLVGLKKIIYSGNHGFEIEAGGRLFFHQEAKKARPVLREIYCVLSRRFSNDRNVIIEDKKATISLHYRLVENAGSIKRLKKIFKDITRPYVRDKKVCLTGGKKVLEVRPFSKVNKGWALKWIVNRFTEKKTLVIYLGDDRTDEDAFKAVGKRGVSIFVGRKKRSRAEYFLKDTAEVNEFLKRLDSEKR
ncbi:MAG: trehalose-phosphatase [Candidatus Omnitrophota bacterium]|nr:trehalose-phosphatase [Candidatus Omnitrophota bacterium]